jgi:preprotein translocase subunit SecD
MKNRTLMILASLVLGGVIGCASASPSPVGPASTACAAERGVEVKLVSATGEGEHVPAWSGEGAVLEPKAWIASADVQSVAIVQDPERPQHALSVRLVDDARARLERVTSENVGRKAAIVVAGRVAAQLTIRDPIRGPALLVTGGSEADVDAMTRALCVLPTT